MAHQYLHEYLMRVFGCIVIIKCSEQEQVQYQDSNILITMQPNVGEKPPKSSQTKVIWQIGGKPLLNNNEDDYI